MRSHLSTQGQLSSVALYISLPVILIRQDLPPLAATHHHLSFVAQMAPAISTGPVLYGQHTPQVFRYEPLKDDQRQVRLLRLEHAVDGPVHGQLVVQDLDPRLRTRYEAVSYAWGDPDLCETIIITGQPMGVTRNAFEMLKNLRTIEHGHLWIDAICINQRDDVERSHQVQQMRGIYTSARRVVIYLGESNQGTDFLFETMPVLQQDPTSRVHWGKESERGSVITFPTLQIDTAHAEVLRSAMQDLLSRPYFKRVWIIQEVSLPNDGMICCGR